MKFARRSKTKEGVNLTPLIDVVFLLLIFFMVTTTFKTESELSVDLPQASNEAERAEADIRVVVQATGLITVNGIALPNSDSATLIRGLRETGLTGPQITVAIEADKMATHQMVVTVLDAVGKSGYSRVHLATSQESE
ncbi:biopolymer transporter ExbD [uncultured Umboniibacter sp.]|uniref:ExbD/TolR family protein n=1 Tax=uncultured Umboniibacter sp. TaxID=1798917 RepID=UPI00263918E7|nr:biopolymer transporter ExbD [uncultured Umboniibacter sp.]